MKSANFPYHAFIFIRDEQHKNVIISALCFTSENTNNGNTEQRNPFGGDTLNHLDTIHDCDRRNVGSIFRALYIATANNNGDAKYKN